MQADSLPSEPPGKLIELITIPTYDGTHAFLKMALKNLTTKENTQDSEERKKKQNIKMYVEYNPHYATYVWCTCLLYIKHQKELLVTVS